MNRLKAKDIPTWRGKQLEKQAGIDPITGLVIENPCLDHDHVTGHCRQVLDRDTNAFEGKVFNAWRRYLKYKGVTLKKAVFELLYYYMLDYSGNPLHPSHRSSEEKRILRNKRAKRRRKLKQRKEPK